MRWEGRRQSSNVRDMRGQRSRRSTRLPMRMPGRMGTQRRVRVPQQRSPMRSSGGGLGGIVLLLVLFFVLRSCNIDPLGSAGGGGTVSGFDELLPQQTQGHQPQFDPVAPSDQRAQFVATVLAETEDVWNGIFEANGRNYPEPELVLFDRRVQSACGFASAASGPFYCPGDRRVYIDLTFFDQLARDFRASGDFAQAYVVAHEVGHHVQNVIGVLPRFNAMRRTMSRNEQNAMSVRVELQADCFAGIWAHFTEQKGLLERGDLQEALNAASQIGDDVIQQRTRGYVVPESFSHGTSEQRVRWFSRGFESGRFDACDTFSGPA